MSLYDYYCKKCHYSAQSVLRPPHKRNIICPNCGEPLKPLPPKGTQRRWHGGTPS